MNAMKRMTYLLAGLFTPLIIFCQATYYKGEWSTSGGTSLYKAVIKLTITNTVAEAAIYWTYVSCDSSKDDLVKFMKGKQGKSAIEYTAGFTRPVHRDIYLAGKYTSDPHTVIGLDQYQLKLSADGNVLYGKTEAGGAKNGLFYAILIRKDEAEKEIGKIKKEIDQP
jgi:hypothetical protein